MVIAESELTRLQDHLTQIPDPRRQWGNLRHKLVDMLVIALCTVIIGEDEFEATEAVAYCMKLFKDGLLVPV
jgi:hypothetical protein